VSWFQTLQDSEFIQNIASDSYANREQSLLKNTNESIHCQKTWTDIWITVIYFILYLKKINYKFVFDLLMIIF